MPRPSPALQHWPFAVRLLSVMVTATLVVPLGDAHPLRANPPLAVPSTVITPRAAEPLSSEPAALLPQLPDPPQLPLQKSIGKCPKISTPTAPVPGSTNRAADEWGEITVAQPKIWQFDRVSSLLDGLLRDVEGVSLSDLTQLDPNAQNAAAVRFVQSALEVGVQYDQAAAVTNAINRGNFQLQREAQLQRFQADNAYIDMLVRQRDAETAQLLAAQNTVNALQPLADAKTITKEQQEQLDIANARVKSLTTSLGTINDAIGKASLSSLASAPSLQNTTVGPPASGSTMSSTLSGFADVLKNLPQGLQDNLNSALKSPSLPATKRLDNFITLLYERLAREVSVLQDDLMRDPENEAFLLQFDVGLYPSKKSTDHVARVEFDLDCPGCKIYSLYPGMSAYNLANYTGSSRRTTLWGNILTLLGFGLSASYRQQVDTLQGGLVQSVYIAGFQNGAPDRSATAAEAEHQYFGWYYGQAPTEKLVTPGIRTTFAMLMVPRDLIRTTKDGFGNLNACFLIDIDGGWTRRDNPKFQHSYLSAFGDAAKILSFPGYFPKNDPLSTHNDLNSVVYKRASVKLPTDADDVPLVVRREHDKPHVTRLEYNTVYSPPPAPSSTPPATSTTVSTSSNSTATATNASAPSTPAGSPANGTSTTTTTTTTTSSGPTDKQAQPAPAAPSTYPNLDPLPCPKYECAPVLIRLDRQIDPNLVVTVNGRALQRVRDWRGRATSILPPAQSGSDLSTQAAASGSIFMRQLQNGRSLLESDQFEANSWFPLNARDLLLNVSKYVATEEEFPVIQISEPGGTVTIPYDLQRSTTELLINHFRIKPQTDASISESILRNYSPDTAPPPVLSVSAPLGSGRYTLPTFVPLFGPEPAPKKFYVQVGQTGEELLIGFLPDPAKGPCDAPKENSPCPGHLRFQETHTQVILEDRELGFAWSLSCYVQDEVIACNFPRHEITRAYRSYVQACEADPSGKCPALDEKYRALKNAFQQLVELADEQVKSTAALLSTEQRQATTTDRKKEPSFRQKIAEQAKLEDLPRAFVSGTWLWVEQFDPEGQQRFYSAEPTKIDFLPLSDTFWHELKPISLDITLGLKDETAPLPLAISLSPFNRTLTPGGNALFWPWHFKSADSDAVTVEGCNYTPDLKMAHPLTTPDHPWPQSERTQATVKLLGNGFPNVYQWLDPPPTNDTTAIEKNCGTFKVDTRQLLRDSITFVLTLPLLEYGAKQPIVESEVDVVMHLATSRLKPSFGTPRVIPKFAAAQAQDSGVGASENTNQKVLKLSGWDIYFPESRATDGDKFKIDNELSKWLKFDWTPSLQSKPLPDEVTLHLQVERGALPYLPPGIELFRHWGAAPGIPVPVATLPNLLKLLLPTHVKLISINDHQFALQGENAGLIDAVTVSSGGTSTTVPVAASGNGFVLASFAAPSTKSSDQNSNPSNGTQTSSNTKVVDSGTSVSISINKQNQSTPAPKGQTQQNQQNSNQSSADKTAAPLAAGSYAVTPLVLVGSTPDTAKQDKANNDVKAAQATLAKAQAALKAAKAGSPEEAKSKKAVSQAQSDLKKAQDAKTAADKATIPSYMPLDVTDEKGGPLIFVVPEAKKQDATTPDKGASPPATCAAPCVLAPCAATCPPAPTKPAASTP